MAIYSMVGEEVTISHVYPHKPEMVWVRHPDGVARQTDKYTLMADGGWKEINAAFDAQEAAQEAAPCLCSTLGVSECPKHSTI